MRMDKGKPFMHVEEDGGTAPTFSEKFLYPTVGKGDARFILGVAEEYEHVIAALGPKAVRMILDVKPRLALRLGLPKVVVDCLEDAASEEFLRREERMPSQVILDESSAHAIWQLLHAEYKANYNPEESFDAETLLAYHTLTDGLGDWEQKARQAERDRLPEKLEKQARAREETARRKASRTARQDEIQKILDTRYGDLLPGARDRATLAQDVERATRHIPPNSDH